MPSFPNGADPMVEWFFLYSNTTLVNNKDLTGLRKVPVYAE